MIDTHPIAVQALEMYHAWERAEPATAADVRLLTELVELIPLLASELNQAVGWAHLTRGHRESVQGRELAHKAALEQIVEQCRRGGSLASIEQLAAASLASRYTQPT